MKDRLYLRVAAMLLCITVLCVGVTVFTAPRDISPPTAPSSSLRVVTSFYPVYIAAQNVAGGVDGVTVENMVDSTAGCLHDYAMVAADRVLLQGADVFVMNGAGAEPFLEATLEATPTLTVIDLSAGQSLLEGDHVHDHEHGHEHALEGEAVNSHLWVSPLRYRRQVETLRDGLIAADPQNAAAYTANAAAYIQQIDAVWARLQAAASAFEGVPSVLYHDSLVYLAEDLNLTVAASLNIGEDAQVDPADKKCAEDALKAAPLGLLWLDDQYTVTDDTLFSAAAQTVVLEVDTCVTGDGDPAHWLEAMYALCETWEAAV